MRRPRPRHDQANHRPLRIRAAANVLTLRASDWKTVDVHIDGRPLTAGELNVGDEITIDRRSGEVLKIRRPK